MKGSQREQKRAAELQISWAISGAVSYHTDQFFKLCWLKAELWAAANHLGSGSTVSQHNATLLSTATPTADIANQSWSSLLQHQSSITARCMQTFPTHDNVLIQCEVKTAVFNIVLYFCICCCILLHILFWKQVACKHFNKERKLPYLHSDQNYVTIYLILDCGDYQIDFFKLKSSRLLKVQ